MASEIATLLNLSQQGQAGFLGPEQCQPIRPSDVAVLVNSYSEAAIARDALSRLNIGSVYLSDRGSVLQTPVAHDLLLWLYAYLEPRNPRALRSALGSSILGLSWQDLEQRLSDDSTLESDSLRFQDYQSIWRHQGVLPALQATMRDYRVAENQLASKDGERVLTDIHHIGELLEQASQHLEGEYALVQHYARLISGSSVDSEMTRNRLESEKDLVQVVTVHKSKGLEYPLVFLPFATYTRTLDRIPDLLFVRYRDEQDQVRVAIKRPSLSLNWLMMNVWAKTFAKPMWR